MSKFVHLHTHSHYSLLDGLGKIPELVSRAKKLGMDSLALTDHGVMYGAIEFYKECQKQGIKPIIGVEAYIATRTMQDREPKVDTAPYHLILLAKNEVGYKNLLKLVSAAHLEGYYYKPRVDKEYLKNHAEGLIALTACLAGEIPKLILSNQKEKLRGTVKEYQDIFGPENFYFEMQYHPELEDQKKVNQKLIELSKEVGAGLVASNDIHYVNFEDKDAHEILLAVQTGKDYDDDTRMSLREFDLSLTSPEDVLRNFGQTPEALENTVKIAAACNLKIELGQTIMPKFDVPKSQTAKSYLEKLCREGAQARYGEVSAKIQERLDYELSVIEKCHFEDYFLIVADYVHFAKENGILVGPGRGSAGGSIVAYVLGVTDLDPIKYDLLFERFLNPDRISPPDIDLDFADDRREEVIQYISEKYGADHVAQIITFGVMKARMAIRDVARAMGMSYDDGDRIAKLIPLGMTLDESLSNINELKDIYNNEPKFKNLIDMAKRLENVARNAGTHAAGVVISQKPLTDYVPLQHPPHGEESLVTQYSMNYLEDIGLLKVDILGLSNLAIIKNALRIIRKVNEIEIKLEKLPLDDKKTFMLLSRGETSGVFQLESDGMKRYLKELKPTTFEDILSMVALYRPGPMESVADFIASKHGRKKITYLDPKLEPILKNTYGVIVTQDQVLQIARYFAGFTYGEADILRKAVGKKIKELLNEQKEKFLKGAVKTGASPRTAQAVWNFIEPFASYGFNRAHAACYAMIAYQTAYLKAHYPSAFMAAWLTAEQQNIDKVAFAIAECKRMNLKVLPPDVNESFVEFGVMKKTGEIRFGLAAIKNVGEGVAEAIAEERKKGKFANFEDFLQRLGNRILNKKVIEALAKAGTLDSLVDRAAIISGLEIVIKYLGDVSKTAAENQPDLFGTLTEKPAVGKLNLPPANELSRKERLSQEKELLGMYVSEHPLSGIEGILEREGTPVAEISTKDADRKVKIAGLISATKKIVTRSNEPMIFATVEDTTGKIEILVFPKVLKQNPALWVNDNLIVLSGRVNNKDGTLKMIVDEASPLATDITTDLIDNPPEPTRLVIDLPKAVTKEILLKFKDILAAYPGALPVTLRLQRSTGVQEIKAKNTVADNPELIAKLRAISGSKITLH